MAPRKGGGEMSKKAAGQARKADAAAQKQAAKVKQAEEEEAKEWQKGSKSTAKAEAAAAKAAEAARKKAEKEALLREEEASLPTKAKGSGAKTAQKKNRGIDSALTSFNTPTTLNATGIDNALDALSLTGDSKEKIDRHPERRFKAAYAQYEEQRLEEMKDEKGLRRQQKIDQIRKEFEKHPDNPFNQVSATYNASKEELAAMAEAERIKKEKRLGSPT
ncbi:DUF1014-domain-containing protein [Lindgomyces ingoldianus]|uniref:DUF1014-domain-containing protein n=1 Tax=Lindgomyces ingoldianus TaxID=673940 RepID=A0ACB6QGL8_9PLEO|nr:DUF1014-domain-containing protein [Lindgomyces ingoldianus]KAF2465507.1 DUF1014-domain-containing protein [Lindgomyces ingoldianus]